MTQQAIILKTLQDVNDWVPSYRLVKIDTEYGWLGTSGDRRARQLHEEGFIDRRHNGKYAEYRIKQELKQGTLL